MMTGKENSAMTILMDFAKPCKGKLIGSVILAVLGALCGMIPYIAVSRGIIMICHENYAFSKLAFLALIALAGYLGQVWFGTFSTMKSHESAFIILRNIRMAITEKLSRVPMGTILDTPSGKFKTIIVDTVEKLELPMAHMVPELTANILIPILMLVHQLCTYWRNHFTRTDLSCDDSGGCLLLYGDDEGLREEICQSTCCREKHGCRNGGIHRRHRSGEDVQSG